MKRPSLLSPVNLIVALGLLGVAGGTFLGRVEQHQKAHAAGIERQLDHAQAALRIASKRRVEMLVQITAGRYKIEWKHNRRIAVDARGEMLHMVDMTALDERVTYWEMQLLRLEAERRAGLRFVDAAREVLSGS